MNYAQWFVFDSVCVQDSDLAGKKARQTVILSFADFVESSCNDFQIKKLLESSCFVVCGFYRKSLWNTNIFCYS